MHDIIGWVTRPQAREVASNSLGQNFPNPFNPQTTIAFSVKERGMVYLKIYNVAGQLVRTLANEQFAAGAHKKVWDGRDDAGQAVSSGVYFYKLVAGSFTDTKKMVLLK
jgi:flagellar hook assembly protein FlgD